MVVHTYTFQESISERICSFDHQILLSCISPNLFLCKSGQPSRPHSYDTSSVKSFQISPFSILLFSLILKYYFGTTIRAFISFSFTSHFIFLCLFQVIRKSSDNDIPLMFSLFHHSALQVVHYNYPNKKHLSGFYYHGMLCSVDHTKQIGLCFKATLNLVVNQVSPLCFAF